MFKVHSIALTVALYGLKHAQTANAAGCYPTWTSGGTYIAESMVSASVTTEVAEVKETCTGTSNGCGSDGYRITTPASSTTEKFNYECVADQALHCPSYDPTGVSTSIAWSKEGAACTGTATAAQIAATIPAAWSGGGCPSLYASGSDFMKGTLVSINMGTYTMVYQCVDSINNLFCGMSGYEPGTGQHWDQAWTELGSCTGSMSPTTSPNYVSLPDADGCPKEFDLSGAAADGDLVYEAGDRVSKDGLVYQCSEVNHLYCSQAAYEPGTSVVSGSSSVVANTNTRDLAEHSYWSQAWSVVGWCEGTITPTRSPVHVSLEDMGGCPKESWSVQEYKEGDKVAVDGLVFTCKAWPFTGNCGQAGFAPLNKEVSGGTPDAWKDAWTVSGYCDGTIGPTSSPVFDELEIVGGCPDEWVKGDEYSYNEDDRVSVTVSADPIRAIVYKCKGGSHLYKYCGQFAPDEHGGDQGWTLEGSCDGTIGPTASPVFDALNIVNPSGCPREYSEGTTYAALQTVTVTVSGDPAREIVYQCKGGVHLYKFCGQKGYGPLEAFGYMAWDLRGHCDGTLAPSASPTASPSKAPSVSPTSSPSMAPTASPTTSPSKAPTASPTPPTRRIRNLRH